MRLSCGPDIALTRRGRRNGAGRLARFFAAAALAAALSACASTPRGLLRPVPPAPGTEKVAMLAATTRAPVDDPGVLFGGDRGTGVSYSRIVVSVPPDRQVGTLQLPRTLPGNAATSFVVNSTVPVSRADVLKEFKAAQPGKRRAFVFVHGYNTPFDQAVFRFAQLSHDVDAHAMPILFSWPSRGRLLDYKRDLDNASYSRTDLADLLAAAAGSPSIDEIVILAHSMGGWLAVEALRQLALEKGGVPAKITDLILASPDIDTGVFRRQIEDMGPKRPRITVFISQNDRALRLSRLIARGDARLGAIDLSNADYVRQLSGMSGVTVIDLSAHTSGDRVDHSLFATSPDAVRLIGDRLLDGQIIDDAAVAGPGTAIDAIGSAAGLVLTAPILIFDAASTRTN